MSDKEIALELFKLYTQNYYSKDFIKENYNYFLDIFKDNKNKELIEDLENRIKSLYEENNQLDCFTSNDYEKIIANTYLIDYLTGFKKKLEGNK